MGNSLKKDRELRAKIVINEVSRLTELSDCPSSLTGQALKVVRVNAGETELEFATAAGGGDMLKSENLSGLADYPTSRTNLGIATTANQTDSTNKRFVTDADLTDIGNLSGTNTGDQDLSGKQDILVNQTNIKSINGASILGSGDLVVSGSTDIKQTEVDFGSIPLKMKRFTITDAGVGPTNQIVVSLSYDDPSDGETDSAEWFEDLTVMAKAGTGEFFLYCNSLRNDLNGKVKINYLIG